MNTDTYDINAKASQNVGLQQMRPLLRRLLEDRFRLVIHHEVKETPFYELRPAKGELKIGPAEQGSCVSPDPKKLPKPGQPMPHFCGNIVMRPNSIEAYSVAMDKFVAALSELLGRIVIDKTGIKYNLNIHLELTSDELNRGPARQGPGDPASASPPPDIFRPSIFAGVQEQLGLKPESAEALRRRPHGESPGEAQRKLTRAG